jgi:hypothetical protein
MPNVVILPVGNQSLTNQWPTHSRNFDLITFNYDPSIIKDSYSNLSFAINDYKYPALYTLFNDHPELLSKYDTFWFPDDDLLIDTHEVNKLFSIFINSNMELAQPSVHPSTYLTHHWYLRTNSKFKKRHSNFIEIMCPLFSKTKLIECLPTFNTNSSGYGIELLWDINPINSYVIDEVSVKHIRQVRTSRFYKKLQTDSVDESEELRVILDKLGINSPIELLYIDGGVDFT